MTLKLNPTTAHPTRTRAARAGWVAAGVLAVGILVAGCSVAEAEGTTSSSSSSFFDTEELHTISIEYDEADYEAMIDAYAQTDEKEWITATVTIDGETFEDVGLRLKGNSSLRSLLGDRGGAATNADTEAPEDDPLGEGEGTVSADDPAGLPWLIRLDKYVDGQEFSGRSDFVVRGNNSETSLNEAVALYAIDQAGVAGEDAAFTRLSVNGSDEQLRLVIDVPDDEAWNEDAFGGTGITYKADSSGDYSYRGDSSDDYLDVFDVKFDADDLSQDEAYAPLIAFLDFVNNSTDEEFEAQLSDYLDVQAFADYLAVQDLVSNSDDIDGPGNNSYLHYAPETGLMTIVAWDQNLSYGGLGGMGAGAPGAQPGGADGERMMPPGGTDGPGAVDSGEMPDGMPTDAPLGAPGGGAGGPRTGMMGGDNVLVSRFLENDTFQALYEDALDDQIEAIYDSGDAGAYLDDLVTLLTDAAGDLVDADTIQAEADAISSMLTGDSVSQRGTSAGGTP
ncbi:CotH kinase family protein [Microbacterium sp. ZOR0019]|uniref:CotH kinase family protein n=1 Tax=Microbacterium sp. ZOR0019 TaxID=1339233 RepID=UPI00069139CC|nr:CotH kinase family protein [Microbacterium sp. ZOR0019]